MVKILDKTKDSIIVKMPRVLERHMKFLSNKGFDVLTPSEKRSIAYIKRNIQKDGYISHEALHARISREK